MSKRTIRYYKSFFRKSICWICPPFLQISCYPFYSIHLWSPTMSSRHLIYPTIQRVCPHCWIIFLFFNTKLTFNLCLRFYWRAHLHLIFYMILLFFGCAFLHPFLNSFYRRRMNENFHSFITIQSYQKLFFHQSLRSPKSLICYYTSNPILLFMVFTWTQDAICCFIYMTKSCLSGNWSLFQLIIRLNSKFIWLKYSIS